VVSSDLEALAVGRSARELRHAVRDEARGRVVNHGAFPIFLLGAVLAPLVFFVHPAAQRISVLFGWWYMLVMPVLATAWLMIPAALYTRLLRDAADVVLLERGVVLCPHCGEDLRRYTWDGGLDPVCPECGERFPGERLAALGRSGEGSGDAW